MIEKTNLAQNFSDTNFIRKVLKSTGLIFLGVLLSYFLHVFLAKHFSKEIYGDISVAISLFYGAFFLLLTLNSGRSTAKFLPQYVIDGLWGRISYFLVYHFRLIIFISVIVLLFDYCANTLWQAYIPQEMRLIISYLWVVPIIGISTFATAVIESFGWQFESNFINFVLGYSLFFCVVFSIEYIFQKTITLTSIFIAIAIAEIISISVAVCVFLKKAPKTIWTSGYDAQDKEFWIYILKLFTINGFVLSIFNYIELYTLQFLNAHKGYVGTFSAVSVITSYLFIFPKNINSILRPDVGALSRPDGHDELQKIYNKSFIFLLSTSVVILFIIIFFRDKFLSHFGADYLSADNLLVMVAIANFFSVTANSASTLLRYGGHSRIVTKYVIFSIIVSFIGIVVFVPRLGINAVGYTMLFSLFTYSTLLFMALKAKLKIKPLILF